MERSKLLPRFCFWLTVALAAGSVALRSVAMLVCFDSELGYFNPGILPVLADILYPLAVTSAILIAFLVPKGSLPTELNDRPHRPAALTMGCALVAFFLTGMLLSLLKLADYQAKLLILPIATALPASVYFFLSAKSRGRYSNGLALAGFLPVLWSATAIAETYTDLFTAMNSPVKITLQFGFIGFMLIMVTELRFRLGKAAPRLALALFSIGTFLCLNGALPLILGAFAGKISHVPHVAYAAALLICGLYGGYMLLRFTHAPAAPSAEDTPPAPECREEDASATD